MRRSLASGLAALLVTPLAGCGSAGTTQLPDPSPGTPTSSSATSSQPSGSAPSTPIQTSGSPSGTPRGRWDHVVVVIMENHSYSDIIANRAAPYLNSLASKGVSFSNARGTAHPSQPNYLALFSGSTQGVTDDHCLPRLGADNLGNQLRAAGFSFIGYSESLPGAGYRGCSSAPYAKRHNPWVDFTNLPDSVNQPLTAFPADPSKLPTLSFVIPNVANDMHDGSVTQGDTWLREHFASYSSWAPAHRSLLLITWDEDDRSALNHVPTIAVGYGVRTGTDTEPITHYRLLRTLEDAYGLAPLGGAQTTTAIASLGHN